MFLRCRTNLHVIHVYTCYLTCFYRFHHLNLQIFAEKPFSITSNGNKYSFDELSPRTLTKFRNFEHVLLSSMTSFRMILASNKITKSFNFMNKKTLSGRSAWNKVRRSSRSLHIELLNSCWKND